MYFKRLEMQGFKSFVEPVIIDFNSGVTCVVGPNGSGKSNLSDAIRWVLGEQSAKSIRASKMEDIIFSGTATRKARGMAEVTLVIDNEDSHLPIEFSEVSITRRLYRSGESEYLINNNPCRLRDIKELIMDTGIGVDGYSIISQGKITELVDSKPELRREIFEEAAGVVMYKSKKQESERKLEATQINLDRVNDIIGEIEGRIDSLKDDSLKAKEYIELRDRRKDLEINITLRNVDKFSESNETGERDVRELTNRIENVKFEKTQLDISLDEKRNRFDNIDKLGNDARNNLLNKVQEINDITSKSQVDSEKLSALERDIARITDEIESLNNKLENEVSNSSKKDLEKDEISKKIDIAEIELQDAIKIYNEKVAKNLEIEEAVQSSKNEIMELSHSAIEKRSDAKSYEQFKDNLMAQKEKLLNEEKEFEESKKDITLALEEIETKLEENEELVRLNHNEKEDKIKDQNQIASDLKDNKVKVEDIKLNISRIISRKKTIEEMEANYDGYNNAVRFLMKKGISGINGVVAELINVPSKYEVAIETSLGATLQNIVCDKDQDAKKAIELLKENSAGRLTFLPIESIDGKVVNVNQAITKSRGYIGIASDIISYDKKYEKILRYLLGRTVIVSDMDTAISLSKIESNGLRYVTLDGEVINTSGAITGGKYKNQTANLLSRRNEIERLSQEIKNLENKLNSLENEVSNLESLNEKVSNEVISYISKENELQIENANLKAKLESLKLNENDSLEVTKRRNRDLENIENDFLNANNMIEKSLKEADNFDLTIKGIEAELTLKGLELDSSKLEISDANELVTEKRIKKTSFEKEYEKIDSLLQVVLDTIDQLSEQIDKKNDELENIILEKNRMIFGNSDSNVDITKLTKEKEELEGYINEVDKEKESLSKEISELSKRQISIEDDINDMISRKQDYEIKLAKNETQLDVLKQRLLEDYEITYAQALELKKEDFVYSSAVKEAKEIRIRMDELGDVNIGAIAEYEQVSERYSFLNEQRDDILKAKDELDKIISNIDKTIKVKFKDNFDKVAANFELTFKELFGGGEAELSLVDENNPLESGVDINVQPPGKKIQNIEAFSGGEKTMIGLALMIAVLKTKPTPFCILDEVEAALDDANIDKFAESLHGFKDTQFAVITHQKATMEHADVLYGVTMPERGISKVLSLKLGDDFDLGEN